MNRLRDAGKGRCRSGVLLGVIAGFIGLGWALQQAFARHPLARARKAPAHAFSRSYRWEISPHTDIDPLRIANCSGDRELAEIGSLFESLRVPLIESPPVRVCLAHDPAGDVVFLNINHAASRSLLTDSQTGLFAAQWRVLKRADSSVAV
jgi:hypothetical protein